MADKSGNFVVNNFKVFVKQKKILAELTYNIWWYPKHGKKKVTTKHTELVVYNAFPKVLLIASDVECKE